MSIGSAKTSSYFFITFSNLVAYGVHFSKAGFLVTESIQVRSVQLLLLHFRVIYYSCRVTVTGTVVLCAPIKSHNERIIGFL